MVMVTEPLGTSWALATMRIRTSPMMMTVKPTTPKKTVIMRAHCSAPSQLDIPIP